MRSKRTRVRNVPVLSIEHHQRLSERKSDTLSALIKHSYVARVLGRSSKHRLPLPLENKCVLHVPQVG